MQGIEIKDICGIQCIKIDMPNAPLILLKADRGYVMCGYLNPKTAEKLGDAACMVRGIKTIEDALNAGIVYVSSRAKELGIKEGMVAREVLKMMK